MSPRGGAAVQAGGDAEGGDLGGQADADGPWDGAAHGRAEPVDGTEGGAAGPVAVQRLWLQHEQGAAAALSGPVPGPGVPNEADGGVGLGRVLRRSPVDVCGACVPGRDAGGVGARGCGGGAAERPARGAGPEDGGHAGDALDSQEAAPGARDPGAVVHGPDGDRPGPGAVPGSRGGDARRGAGGAWICSRQSPHVRPERSGRRSLGSCPRRRFDPWLYAPGRQVPLCLPGAGASLGQ